MTELPWYVRLPENKDKIDLIELRIALGANYEFYPESKRPYEFYYVDSDGSCGFTNDFSRVKNYKNISSFFEKQPEHTLDNLPEKWFVELSDDVDKVLLAEKLGMNVGGNYKYYGIGWDTRLDNNIERFYGCTNLTHLFKKKKEEMEIIEINGKKYHKVDTGGEFENGDLIIFETGDVVKFIGYDNNAIVYADNLSYYHSENEKVFKLEEIKIWHYAITENEFGLCHTIFYSSEGELKRACPNALEYRTFEEQL